MVSQTARLFLYIYLITNDKNYHLLRYIFRLDNRYLFSSEIFPVCINKKILVLAFRRKNFIRQILVMNFSYKQFLYTMNHIRESISDA